MKNNGEGISGQNGIVRLLALEQWVKAVVIDSEVILFSPGIFSLMVFPLILC